MPVTGIREESSVTGARGSGLSSRFSVICFYELPSNALDCATVNDLPALLLAGGMFGDFLGGLLILASFMSMLEIKFSIDGSPKKRSKK